jgi:pimeloyl-ACP methyl ester carboxylesterase
MEAAIGDFCLTWALIQRAIAGFTRAISYDRAGLGWSQTSTSSRTGASMVEELRQLLQSSSVKGPFVLVGHSFSALLVRLFAYKNPHDVAGLVLLDPAHEDQFQRFPPQIIGRSMCCKGCPGERAAHWSPDSAILKRCIDERHLASCSECGDFPCGRLEEWAECPPSMSAL